MNDMLYCTRRSLRYLGELRYDISLMWIPFHPHLIPSHVGTQGNERADVLANEGSISGTLFLNQAGLTTVNTSDIHTRARTRLLTEWQDRWNDSEISRYCYSIVTRVSVEAWVASTVDEMVLLVAISGLGSNHTCTRAHLQRIYVVQDALCRCGMGSWATLHTNKRATRKTPGCRDRSRQINKRYIGNAQYGHVKAHF
jgi:hypothetical protein